MGQVVDFQAAREGRGPHCEGPAECILCRYQWEAVVPLGTIWLECPTCGSEKGHFLGPAIHKDHYEFVCECSNNLFTLGTDGTVLCPNCGWTHATYELIK
jgi:Zn finger protein HypA/HybF involved in hydrogenase expression